MSLVDDRSRGSIFQRHRIAKQKANREYFKMACTIAAAFFVGYCYRLPSRIPPFESTLVLSIFISPVGALIMSRIFREASAYWARAKRLASTDAHYALIFDSRPPVLYLRSFIDDGRAPEQAPVWHLLFPLNLLFRPWTYEQNLVHGLKAYGPVIAIGRPGESLPELGAHRLYVYPDQDWQTEVRRLMADARLIVFRPAMTPGLLWEFRHALSNAKPGTLVVDLEPTGALLHEWQVCLPHSIPNDFPLVSFLHFDERWRPRAAMSIEEIVEERVETEQTTSYVRESNSSHDLTLLADTKDASCDHETTQRPSERNSQLWNAIGFVFLGAYVALVTWVALLLKFFGQSTSPWPALVCALPAIVAGVAVPLSLRPTLATKTSPPNNAMNAEPPAAL